jgi:hypothetical protein
VDDGQPGLAVIINRIIDLCEEQRTQTADGRRVDVDTVWPSQVLDIIEGRS